MAQDEACAYFVQGSEPQLQPNYNPEAFFPSSGHREAQLTHLFILKQGLDV